MSSGLVGHQILVYYFFNNIPITRTRINATATQMNAEKLVAFRISEMVGEMFNKMNLDDFSNLIVVNSDMESGDSSLMVTNL